MVKRPYRTIERAHSVLVDGADPSYLNVLWRPPTHARFPTLYRFGLGYAQLQNRAAGVNAMGVGARLDPSRWKAGQTAGVAPMVFTDDTPDAQDAGVGDFLAEGNADNTGFAVFAYDIFNIISLWITAADVGAAPIRTMQYTKADGTWGTISTSLVPILSGANWGLGEKVIAWLAPEDWAPAVAAHGTNVPIGLYGIWFNDSTAPVTSGATIRSMSVCQMLFGTADVAAGGIFDTPHGDGAEHVFECLADALVGFVSVAHNQHRFTLNARTLG